MDEQSLRLLKAMREQLGESSGRAVDAGDAAKSLGMHPGTLERCLLYLVRAEGRVREDKLVLLWPLSVQMGRRLLLSRAAFAKGPSGSPD